MLACWLKIFLVRIVGEQTARRHPALCVKAGADVVGAFEDSGGE